MAKRSSKRFHRREFARVRSTLAFDDERDLTGELRMRTNAPISPLQRFQAHEEAKKKAATIVHHAQGSG